MREPIRYKNRLEHFLDAIQTILPVYFDVEGVSGQRADGQTVAPGQPVTYGRWQQWVSPGVYIVDGKKIMVK